VTHPVVAALRGGDVEARRDACDAAPGDPEAVRVVEALVGALADDSPAVVHAAVRARERIGRQHAAVVPALDSALRHDDARVRLEAAWTWARLEPPPVKLLPVVIGGLEHAVGDARWRAARLLVELGRLHGEVVPVVESLAGPGHPPRVRRIALGALRELAPGSDATLRAHLEASRDTDVGLERLALTGLAGLGPAPETWKRLAEVIAEHPDGGCRRVAVTAVATLGDPPEAVREALARGAATDTDASVRRAAERALGLLAATPSTPDS
jgi:HEAT repeat protein